MAVADIDTAGLAETAELAGNGTAVESFCRNSKAVFAASAGD